MKKVVYSFVVADLFHYGHLQLLQTAKSLGDLHICGVLTDGAAESYRPRPITNLEERVALISSIKCVDRVMIQDQKDPTENLRKIHREFPTAELVLVHGNDWSAIPGREYVESVGGRVFQPEYYRRLSDSQVRASLARQTGEAHFYYEQFTEHFRVGDIEVFDGGPKHFIMSTKANTLKSLCPLLRKSRIEQMFIFRASEWQENAADILRRIRSEFAPGPVVVRSSAVNEDTYHTSQAGSYRSELNVSLADASLRRAVESVLGSYREKANLNPANQVLVQPCVEGVRCSGVIFTCNPRSGAPYYVINYDNRTGNTETVTGGHESDSIEIFRMCGPDGCPREWRPLLEAVRELEEVIPGTPLDIEFGIAGRGEVSVFQVRPLVLSKENHHAPAEAVAASLARAKKDFRKWARPVSRLAGRTTAYSDMAFWNPAEMIGDFPTALAVSLYRHLITDRIWNQALLPLGYSDVGGAPLLVELGGKPYIDLRVTFNALLPAGLPAGLRGKSVQHYLNLLRERPELHDKVEFEIVDNCYHFTLDRRLKRLERAGIRKSDRETLRKALHELTSAALEKAPRHLRSAEEDCRRLEERRALIISAVHSPGKDAAGAEKLSAAVVALLHDCKRWGTLPFSRVARLAFMASSLLRSAIEAGYVDEDVREEFMDHVRTVAKEMAEDFRALGAGVLGKREFLIKYGHLRPGTYDICSPRYDGGALFEEIAGSHPAQAKASRPFALSRGARARLDAVLSRHRLGCDSEGLFGFIRASLEGRERIKFEFTKSLSEALELTARAGESLGLDRDALSHLDVDAIRQASQMTGRDSIRKLWAEAIERNQKRRAVQSSLSLPALVFSEGDLEVVRHFRSKPNFITRRRVWGQLARIGPHGHVRDENLEKKIVLLEKADPGYDWIFTKSIAGLVTKYGGVASHMAIRCAEFDIPAAIGCGETIYRSLLAADAAVLDCGTGQVRAI
ncbi:MAG: adenylyltransferase/cytidyltransferase family protein [Candidatus Tectomicrobia bacterium]|uniref:Adenylyltransferase/cytidyltransferase family protein n=1 Tax=Tectimicrobiota bacterium TaxID=2528274 RepID=A0A932HXK8_UNCTE|nr:adenylyltransferase/cytidyltransferase family protein [Candidatus Tectomicrobia bacterium]